MLLLAAGEGSRFHGKRPKQWLSLLGKPVIVWSLLAFQELITQKEITPAECVLVCNPPYRGTLTRYLKRYTPRLLPYTRFAPGGATRQESVYNGLKLCTGRQVLLHESARPCFLPLFFDRLLSAPEENVTLAAPLPFTVLQKAQQENRIAALLNRELLVNIQLPQKFNRNELTAAHEQARHDGKCFTDDSSLLFYYGGSVATAEGSPNNIKITYPGDLAIAKAILKKPFS